MVYFATLDPGQDWTTLANRENEDRKVSIHGAIGSGEYLFISNFTTGGGGIGYRNKGNFLHDENIGAWDNLKALERLLQWLVGEVPYPD